MADPDDLLPSTPARPAPGAWDKPTALVGVNAPDPPTWLWAAMLEAFFCCLPTGIVALVYGSMVQARMRAGDVEGAVDASNKARLWVIAGPALWILTALVVGVVSALDALLAPVS